MKLRRIPGTEIDVSAVCLGTMTYGRPVARPEAIRLTLLALDLGINFIDTANIYEGYNRVLGSPGGVSEEILGEALAGRRQRVILTTKVGNPVGPGPEDVGLGRKHVRRELEKSLRRLRTDYVDFYLAHRTDPNTPLEESVALFDALVKSGQVRYWGFSNFEAPDIHKIIEIAEAHGYQRPRLSQPRYSLLVRDIEKDHLPACRKYGIGVAPYRVLEGGMLSGKYVPGKEPPTGTRGQEMPGWVPAESRNEEALRKIKVITEVAAAAHLTMTQCAIAWVMAQEGISSPLIGVTREEQLREAVRAAEVQLDAASLEELRAL
jgi:aryl-alcohol dehydrogenase-like predicted oxidoreductase